MIIYITRKFPPSVGGMQRFNFKLAENLKGTVDLHLISWGGSQAFLPFFIFYAFLKCLFIGLKAKISCIYVSDGLLSPLGYALKAVLRTPVACGIHGRDIAFGPGAYQFIVPKALTQLDKIICVSHHLKAECIKRNVPEKIITVIPNGVDIEDFQITPHEDYKPYFESVVGRSLEHRHILITVGRLCPKKGIDVFIKNVLPEIIKQDKQVIYLVAGEGPSRESIQSLIIEKKLNQHVFLLGKIAMNSGKLPALYRLADVFVMPNVRTKGDMEGFGIVAIEAGAAALPVVASNVDGIAEAICDQRNGYLIEENNFAQFSATILALLNDKPARKAFGMQAYHYVRENFSWKNIAKRYAEIFESL